MALKNLPEGIVDETMTLTLQEFTELSQANEQDIVEMIQIGILEPFGREARTWRFTLLQLQRLKKAQRLQHDLKLNLEGVALSLELMDEIKALQTELENLRHELQLLTRF